MTYMVTTPTTIYPLPIRAKVTPIAFSIYEWVLGTRGESLQHQQLRKSLAVLLRVHRVCMSGATLRLGHQEV